MTQNVYKKMANKIVFLEIRVYPEIVLFLEIRIEVTTGISLTGLLNYTELQLATLTPFHIETFFRNEVSRTKI